jgi:hypothetical protein
MLAALVAVFIQAFVIQTHIHETAPFRATAFERAADHEAPGHTHVSATHKQAGCITCIAFASAGVSLATDAFTLIASLNATTAAATLAIRQAPRAISYSWRSRAPPIAL